MITDICKSEVSPDYEAINKQVAILNNSSSSEEEIAASLLKIGIEAKLVSSEVLKNQELLDLEQRLLVVNWLVCQAKYQLKKPLVRLIIGDSILKCWQQESQFRYPNCELVLLFEDWGEEELVYTFYFQPMPGCPDDIKEHDFPLKHYHWELGSLFFGDFPSGAKSDWVFTIDCYPNQSTWSVPGTRMSSYRIQPEPNHLTVSQILDCEN